MAEAAAPRAVTPNGGLAGMTLEQVRQGYNYDLFQDFLPFMDKYVVDHKIGGFLCDTDRDGTNLTENKLTWYEGRGIWVYSFLYNHCGRDAKHLEAARKSVDFILKARPANGAMWPRAFARDGRPLTPPVTEVYGDLFVAEGLAEYSQATGEQRYWDLAKELILKCVRAYDRPDYEPNIGQTYLGQEAPPFPGARIQGVWMVLLRAATQMLEMRPDPDLQQLAARAVNAVMTRHFNPEFLLNNELLNHDLSRPGPPYSQLVYTGHAIETLWMVLHEAVRLKDKALFDTAAARFRRHVEVAWDDVYGGVFRNLQNVERNVWSVDKVLWAQEEVMIGSLIVLEHTGAPWAAHMFSKMFLYVQERYPLRRYGLPLWISQSDRKVTFVKNASRVENYHHPRHLMLNLLALDRMIARGGKASGVFG